MVTSLSARFRVRLFVALAIWLFGSTAALPVSAEETRFVTVIADLPLMPGLVERDAESVVFETPDGRIVETFATGRTDRSSVTRFYEDSLPQLGWVREARLRFHREGETLTIDFPDGQSGADLTVRFSLSPGVGK